MDAKAHFFDIDKEWDTFINHLKSPCRDLRIPFMAPDLPPNYVSRDGLLERLIPAVVHAKRGRLALTTALHGAGGLGKTTLAAALCHQQQMVSAYDDGVLWVTLGKTPNLVEVLGRLCTALTGRPPEFFEAEAGAGELAALLKSRTCLIVLDDVWTAPTSSHFSEARRTAFVSSRPVSLTSPTMPSGSTSTK